MNKRILILIFIGFVLIGVVLIIRTTTYSSNFQETFFQKTSKMPILGIYEVCSDIKDCNLEQGIEKIKTSGAKTVIVTVVDEEDSGTAAYYPSKYLPLVQDVPDNYLKRIVESAHQNRIKVYASINMPHKYWLAKHPDWIAVWSNGKPADTYEQDYFHQFVPPSRVIAEQEYIDFLKNIIEEVISYGVNGIDLNDNFQFSDQWLEQTNETLYSSFDDFTIEKFEKDTNLIIQGDSAKKRAEYIENNPDVYKEWLKWRSEQVTQLLKIFKTDIPFRPHLLTYGNPYQYYGLDYKEIAKEIDTLYLMITPEKTREEYFEIIKDCQDTNAKRIITSTYLFKADDYSVVEKDEEKILQRMRWMEMTGVDEIYVYNFKLIEENKLWLTIENIFDKILERRSHRFDNRFFTK